MKFRGVLEWPSERLENFPTFCKNCKVNHVTFRVRFTKKLIVFAIRWLGYPKDGLVCSEPTIEQESDQVFHMWGHGHGSIDPQFCE